MVELQTQLSDMEVELQKQHDPSLTDVEFAHRTCALPPYRDATHNPMLRFLVTAVIEIMDGGLNLIAYRFRERKLTRRLA